MATALFAPSLDVVTSLAGFVDLIPAAWSASYHRHSSIHRGRLRAEHSLSLIAEDKAADRRICVDARIYPSHTAIRCALLSGYDSEREVWANYRTVDGVLIENRRGQKAALAAFAAIWDGRGAIHNSRAHSWTATRRGGEFEVY